MRAADGKLIHNFPPPHTEMKCKKNKDTNKTTNMKSNEAVFMYSFCSTFRLPDSQISKCQVCSYYIEQYIQIIKEFVFKIKLPKNILV